MPTKSVQFRLRSLFWAVTCCATLLCVRETFIRPNIDGVTLRGDQVVLRLTPEYAQQVYPADSNPTGWELDTYAVIPLNSALIFGSLIVAASVAMFCVLRLPSRRRNQHRQASVGIWVSMFMASILLSQAAALAEDRVFQTHSRLTLGTEANRSASVRIGDIDGDQDLDVVIANGRHWPQQNFVFVNQGTAKFSIMRNLGDERATTYATELADLDGDGDGDLDVVVGNDQAPCRVFLNDGSGRFRRGENFGVVSSIRSLTLADLDGDGDVDILATSRGMPNRIYRNDGDAHFDTGRPFGTANDSTIDVAVADLNGDGHLDLILANRDSQQNYVLLNNGHMEFTKRIPFGTGRDQTRAVAVGDLDGDGNLDWVVGNIGEPNAVYLGDGNGGVRDSTTVGNAKGATYTIAIADMDRDGNADLIVGNVLQPNAVLFNQGDGKNFREVRFGERANATYSLAVGDLNGDGYPDIAVANSDAENFVFINRRRRK